MPSRSQHPCYYPGCAQLTRGRYCEKHERVVRMEYQRKHERGSSSEQGYGGAWRGLRVAFLRQHPVCIDPFGDHARAGQTMIATEVDHIMPRSMGGKDEWENLQALCKSCHSRKSAVEGSRWRRGGGA